MSAEILNVTAEVIKNSSLVVRAANLAKAHPIAAAVVATAVVGAAGYGIYTGASKYMRRRNKLA